MISQSELMKLITIICCWVKKVWLHWIQVNKQHAATETRTLLGKHLDFNDETEMINDTTLENPYKKIKSLEEKLEAAEDKMDKMKKRIQELEVEVLFHKTDNKTQQVMKHVSKVYVDLSWKNANH